MPQRHHFSNLKHPRLWLLAAFFFVLIIVGDIVALHILQEKSRVEAEQQVQLALGEKTQAMISKCNKTDTWNRCYSEMFASLAKDYDFEFSLKLLKQLESQDARINDCHVIAHKIMGEEVAKHPERWKELLQLVDPNICNYGFIHGIIEGRSRVDSSFTLNKKTIPEFCQAMLQEKGSRGVDQTCVHIIGHVLLVQTKGNVDQAVAICSQIPLNLQKECASGIFMENFTRDNLVDHEIASTVLWDDRTISQTEQLCRQYEGKIAYGCWQEISHLYNHRARLTPEHVLTDCRQAPTKELAEGCYLHGVATFIHNTKASTDYFQSVCAVFSDRSFVEQCMSIAVKSLLNSSLTPSKTAITFCLALKERKNECFSMLNDFLSMKLDNSQLELYCSNVPKQFRDYCTGY